MTDQPATIPFRPSHVAERHALIETFRPFMLQRVAAWRLAAVEFEAMMYHGPDNDSAVDQLSNTLRERQHQMVQAIEVYRQVRDIQGLG